MASKAGIKKIGFCTAGTLLTTPTNKYSIGLREKVGLVISDTKQIEDYKNRKLPNMKNFKIEPVSLQPTLDFVEKLLGYINLGADVQIVTNPQSASA
ncbi:MAG: hypothetical protein K9G44_14215, partial [Melioribacteraceae bacterium]|nr:hypothetical protein [Melioribacteraceae bacterium]